MVHKVVKGICGHERHIDRKKDTKYLSNFYCVDCNKDVKCIEEREED